MSFAIPTISETVLRVRRAFRSELKGSDAAIWPNNLYVTAKVKGGALKALFDRLDIVRKDIHAHTAGLDGVLRHATEFGLARRPAVAAAGTVTVVTSGPASVLKGARLLRSDGLAYITTSGRTVRGVETFRLPVAAEVAGAAGNLDAEASLDPDTDTSGAIESVTVDAPGLIGGAEPEDIGTSLRARVLFRKRNPIHGGAPADYVTWASEVPGVTRVFVARRPFGNGTVGVYPMMDDSRPEGIPLAADIARIAEHVALYEPAGADVIVAAPTRVPINITVTKLSPNDAATQALVRTELIDAFMRRGRVAGTDPGHPALPFLTTLHTFSASWVSEAVSQSLGENSHRLAPLDDVVVPAYHVPVLGTLTFPQTAE